ncbi:hypothetical protein OPT61_g7189 [Boeremia exigua]|uniref:Uncharacterized protein n=1 Tax=Boeremia exigua TaxID=749465 RepID=A0ACC2I395_9PLEO|nr:hypothetical protein OPT61_g7189 [Boeremia exigua]
MSSEEDRMRHENAALRADLKTVRANLHASKQKQAVMEDALSELRQEFPATRNLLRAIWGFLDTRKIKIPEDLTNEYLALRHGDPLDVRPVFKGVGGDSGPITNGRKQLRESGSGTREQNKGRSFARNNVGRPMEGQHDTPALAYDGNNNDAKHNAEHAALPTETTTHPTATVNGKMGEVPEPQVSRYEQGTERILGRANDSRATETRSSDDDKGNVKPSATEASLKADTAVHHPAAAEKSSSDVNETEPTAVLTGVKRDAPEATGSSPKRFKSDVDPVTTDVSTDPSTVSDTSAGVRSR